MQVKRIIVGELETNCYIIFKEKKALIIDPGAEAEKIEKQLYGIKVEGILLTHAHFDHLGALSYFEKKYKLKCNEKNSFTYEIIKTPGHTKDSLSFYFPEEKIMFTGDFIFKNTIGRMDLPGGSPKEMLESLKTIEKYSDDIQIYPGHGEKTNLGIEKKNFSFYFKFN